MVSTTTLVLTVALVTVQLAMGQFSPGIVRSLLGDRPSRLAIGRFAATFNHLHDCLRQLARRPATGRSAPLPRRPGGAG
jgi:uncharacterized membrane protein